MRTLQNISNKRFEVLLCRPNYFDVSYVINPWMKPGRVDTHKAKKQWNGLVKKLKELGIGVNIIEGEKGLPDMVFATDQAVIKGNTAVLSNFKYKERRGETIFYKKWLKEHGFNIINLPKDLYFEGGGDSVWSSEDLFVGVGFRNSKGVNRYLENILNTRVIEIHLVDPFFYHTDTCFFPLDSETLFYYPPAISEKSKNLLKKIFKKNIAVTKKEAFNFALNSLIFGKDVITQKGNKKFVFELKKLGYKSHEIDLTEFAKAGGGIHCSVLTLVKMCV